ncbi:MAG TPA: ATP-binding protein [Candidatus Elarobacter sp.]|nr:ATP-binding protein [Candidatus Elarobacter sp.]
MIDPRTLRGRLGIAYAVALLLALIAFAAVTLVIVDRTQRTALDDRLQVALRAIAALADVRSGAIVLDEQDRSQFGRIVGARYDGAVLDAALHPVVATGALDPAIAALAEHGGAARGLATVTARAGATRVAFAPLLSHGRRAGVVLVWRELDEVEELDRRVAILLALAIPVVAAFALFAGGAVAARGLRPLNEMAALASEIEAHDLSRRLGLPPRRDELGRLYATFDRMLDRLEAAFARQRRFTGDASHELRAPLAVIRAEADLALRRARAPGEYERALRAIAAQSDYLEAVTADLLAAARAESGRAPAAEVDLATIAHDVAERLQPLARERGLELGVTGEVAPVHGDARALERALVALVHNAVRHARSAVHVSVERAGDVVRVCVADDGAGFSEEGLAHAKERFWRDDAARAHDAADRENAARGGASGAGLGLAIADAIVTASGGTLTLANAPDGGASVVAELRGLRADER